MTRWVSSMAVPTADHACRQDDQCLTDGKRGKHSGLLQDDPDEFSGR